MSAEFPVVVVQFKIIVIHTDVRAERYFIDKLLSSTHVSMVLSSSNSSEIVLDV